MNIYAISAFILAPLAAVQLVEVLHHGSLFYRLRCWARRMKVSDVPSKQLVGKLIGCPFCLSHWAGAVVTLLVLISIAWPIFAVPVWWLAIVRASNLINDIGYQWTRSPGKDAEDYMDVNVGHRALQEKVGTQ